MKQLVFFYFCLLQTLQVSFDSIILKLLCAKMFKNLKSITWISLLQFDSASLQLNVIQSNDPTTQRTQKRYGEEHANHTQEGSGQVSFLMQERKNSQPQRGPHFKLKPPWQTRRHNRSRSIAKAEISDRVSPPDVHRVHNQRIRCISLDRW